MESGAALWSAPVRAGDTISYTYIHSVTKTPVQSRLRIVGPEDGFVVEREQYLAYGPGLEFRTDMGVTQEGDWTVVFVDRPVAQLLLRIAGTVDQTLIVGPGTVFLGDVAPFGRRVMLEVRP